MYCASLKNYSYHEKIAYYKKNLLRKCVTFLPAYLNKPLSYHETCFEISDMKIMII